MTLAVDPDWWKTLFDEIYLVTDARTVQDETLTQQEVDIFCNLVPMGPEVRVLDLCGGQGRHAIELSRRGGGACTVLDYSPVLLAEGNQNADQHNLSVTFVQGDARQTPLMEAAFDVVLILGNSLGYSAEEDADLSILRESRRLLTPGGWLLLDVTDGCAVRQTLTPNAWHEIGDDVVVCRQREIRSNQVSARELVLSKAGGVIRDKTYSIHIYARRELETLVSRAGFVDIQINAHQAIIDSQEDRGCMNHRLIVIARRP